MPKKSFPMRMFYHILYQTRDFILFSDLQTELFGKSIDTEEEIKIIVTKKLRSLGSGYSLEPPRLF